MDLFLLFVHFYTCRYGYVLFVLLVYPSILCTGDSLYKVIAYDVKPYIWKENDTFVGILPEISKTIEFYCHEYLHENQTFLDYVIVLDEIADLHELFYSNISYGEHQLQNVTEENALWFPYFKNIETKDHVMFRKRNATYHKTLEVTELVFVVPTWTISFGNKFFQGLHNGRVLLFFMLCLSLTFSVGIWLFERKTNECINESFYYGLPNCLWLIIVTLITVGYGDIFPKRAPTKLLMIVWMFTGLFLTSLLTANVLNTVSSVESFIGKNIAVVNNSYEQQIVKHNYNPERLVLTRSNKEATEAVLRGEVDVAVMNADIASWYYIDITSERKLSIVKSIPVHIPIFLISNPHFRELDDIWTCIKNHWAEIVEFSTVKYERGFHIQSKVNDNIKDALLFPVYQTAVILMCVSVFVGLIVEHAHTIWDFIKKRRCNDSIEPSLKNTVALQSRNNNITIGPLNDIERIS